jgi:hypothetical protein
MSKASRERRAKRRKNLQPKGPREMQLRRQGPHVLFERDGATTVFDVARVAQQQDR